MFLGYACNRLGTYFNLLIWIRALESCGTREFIGVFVTFIRVVYRTMIYMSVPIPLNGLITSIIMTLGYKGRGPKHIEAELIRACWLLFFFRFFFSELCRYMLWVELLSWMDSSDDYRSILSLR